MGHRTWQLSPELLLNSIHIHPYCLPLAQALLVKPLNYGVWTLFITYGTSDKLLDLSVHRFPLSKWSATLVDISIRDLWVLHPILYPPWGQQCIPGKVSTLERTLTGATGLHLAYSLSTDPSKPQVWWSLCYLNLPVQPFRNLVSYKVPQSHWGTRRGGGWNAKVCWAKPAATVRKVSRAWIRGIWYSNTGLWLLLVFLVVVFLSWLLLVQETRYFCDLC